MAPAVTHKKGKPSKAVKAGSRGAKRMALFAVGSESNKVRKQTNSDVSQQPSKLDMMVGVDDDAFMINAHVCKENKASAATMKTRRVVKLRKHADAGATSSDVETTACAPKKENSTPPDDDVNDDKSTLLQDEEDL